MQKQRSVRWDVIYLIEKIIGAGKGKTSGLISESAKSAHGFTGNPAAAGEARRLMRLNGFVKSRSEGYMGLGCYLEATLAGHG